MTRTVMTAKQSKAFTVQLGRNLRALRERKGWSLPKVEELSGGVFKPAVVGSYERADRRPTIDRLQALVDFYGAELSDVVPTRHPAVVVSALTAADLPFHEVQPVLVGDRIIYLRLLKEAS